MTRFTLRWNNSFQNYMLENLAKKEINAINSSAFSIIYIIAIFIILCTDMLQEYHDNIFPGYWKCTEKHDRFSFSNKNWKKTLLIFVTLIQDSWSLYSSTYPVFVIAFVFNICFAFYVRYYCFVTILWKCCIFVVNICHM